MVWTFRVPPVSTVAITRPRQINFAEFVQRNLSATKDPRRMAGMTLILPKRSMGRLGFMAVRTRLQKSSERCKEAFRQRLRAVRIDRESSQAYASADV